MKQQILDILDELAKWRSVRKLSIESQREGYIRNIMEELGELAAAIKANNEHEYIDALCDIMVFAGNCVYKEKFDKAYIPWETLEELGIDTSETALLKGLLGNTYDMTYDPTMMIASLYSFCRDLAAKKGYDFFKCMQEVLKQINSRTGAWNEDLKKWVKDTSPEAKSKEYQADFDKCKLN